MARGSACGCNSLLRSWSISPVDMIAHARSKPSQAGPARHRRRSQHVYQVVYGDSGRTGGAAKGGVVAAETPREQEMITRGEVDPVRRSTPDRRRFGVANDRIGYARRQQASARCPQAQVEILEAEEELLGERTGGSEDLSPDQHGAPADAVDEARAGVARLEARRSAACVTHPTGES